MLFELAMLKPNTRHIRQYVNRQYMFSLELTNLPATNYRASKLVGCGCSSLLSTQHPVKLQAWVADSVKTSAACFVFAVRFESGETRICEATGNASELDTLRTGDDPELYNNDERAPERRNSNSRFLNGGIFDKTLQLGSLMLFHICG